MNLLQNKVLLGIILTFIIGGLGSITGIVSPQVASIITLILSGLTAIGHSTNLVKGL